VTWSKTAARSNSLKRTLTLMIVYRVYIVFNGVYTEYFYFKMITM